MPLEKLSIAVVGARQPNTRRKGQPTGDRQMEILLCEPGDPVELRPEPQNKADGNAIAVYSSRGVQIGYVVADRTIIIRRAWEEAREVRAIFQGAISGGAAIRVAFDGRIPMLPPPPPPRAMPDVIDPPDSDPGDDGFYPDYIPPED